MGSCFSRTPAQPEGITDARVAKDEHYPRPVSASQRDSKTGVAREPGVGNPGAEDTAREREHSTTRDTGSQNATERTPYLSVLSIPIPTHDHENLQNVANPELHMSRGAPWSFAETAAEQQPIIGMQDHPLAKEIFERLQKHEIGSEKGREIILPESVKSVWAPVYYREFYRQQVWYDLAWDKDLTMDQYVQIMSILICTSFSKWDDFRAIFINSMQRQDQDLPFDLTTLQREDFLGKIYGKQFFTSQFQFCPVRIQERSGVYHMNSQKRFPWVDKSNDMSKPIGEGAFGKVMKRTIAAGFLEYENRTINARVSHLNGKKL
jgi:hypothetical protein